MAKTFNARYCQNQNSNLTQRAARIWPRPPELANAVKYLLKLCAPRGPMWPCLLLGGDRERGMVAEWPLSKNLGGYCAGGYLGLGAGT